MRPRIYGTLLAILAVATVILSINVFSSSPEFPQLMSPPENPPEAQLLLKKANLLGLRSSGSDSPAQQGIIAHYNWFIDGEVDTFSIVSSLQWPIPVKVSDGDTVIVRLESEAAPLTIEVSQYSHLKPNGEPKGDPMLVTSWDNPRVFKHHRAPRKNRSLAYRKSQENGGWELNMPLSSSDTSFITVWETWLDPDDLSAGPYSANWLFSIRTNGALQVGG